MNKNHWGIVLGTAAGIIDLIPMIVQGLTWDANLSEFFLWIVSGFLISTSSLRFEGYQNGIVISMLVLLPSAILIGWQQPLSLFPIMGMTLILGAGLGHFIYKLNK